MSVPRANLLLSWACAGQSPDRGGPGRYPSTTRLCPGTSARLAQILSERPSHCAPQSNGIALDSWDRCTAEVRTRTSKVVPRTKVMYFSNSLHVHHRQLSCMTLTARFQLQLSIEFLTNVIVYGFLASVRRLFHCGLRFCFSSTMSSNLSEHRSKLSGVPAKFKSSLCCISSSGSRCFMQINHRNNNRYK